MPSFPPRVEPIRKQDQLFQRKLELHFAIKKGFSGEKLIKVVEKLRAAHLSLLKAIIHMMHEKEFQKKPHNFKIEKIEAEIEKWKNKTIEEIINETKVEI